MESFEAIAENLVSQEDFTGRLEVIGDDVTVVGERVSGTTTYVTLHLHNRFMYITTRCC